MDSIISLSYQIHDMLLESEEYLNLKRKEKEMLDDPVSSKLVDDFKRLEEKYGYDKEKDVQKELSQAKIKMNENKKVIAYKEAYKQYQILVGKVTDICFDGVKTDSIFDKILREIRWE